MTPPSDPQPAGPAAPSPRRRRSLWIWALLALAVASAAACGYQLWLRATAHAPPEVDLSHADPDVAEAINQGSQLVRQHPRAAAAWGQLGMTLQAHGFHTQAQTCYERAEEFEPRNPQWPYLRGACALASGADDAIPSLERAVRYGGSSVVPRLTLGDTLLEQGRVDEAEGHFKAVLAVDGNNARALLGMGRVSTARGDLKSSVRYLRLAVAYERKLRQGYELLATASHALGDTEGAEEARREADALPRHAPVWPDPYLDQVAERETGLQITSRRANALFGQGQPAAAVQLLHQLVQRRPDSAPARSGLGRMLVLCKRPAEAVPQLEESLRLDPNQSIPHFYLGAAFFELERYEAAAGAYRRCVEIQANYADAHYELARTLHKLGDREGAVRSARDCLRYNPDSVFALHALGLFLAEQGKFAEALPHLTRAAKLAPGDPDVQRNLLMVQSKSAEKPTQP